MALNLDPADLSDIEKIGTATHFTGHLPSGPHDKVTKRAKTLAAAIRADKLGKTDSGKRPIIYAVTADNVSVHVPAAMIAEARQEGATGPRGRQKGPARRDAATRSPRMPPRASFPLRRISARRRINASMASSPSLLPWLRSATWPR